VQIAKNIEASRDYANGLPILADALLEAGGDDRTAGFFRAHSRWALRALLEAVA
jgi:hypothetical protein